MTRSSDSSIRMAGRPGRGIGVRLLARGLGGQLRAAIDSRRTMSAPGRRSGDFMARGACRFRHRTRQNVVCVKRVLSRRTNGVLALARCVDPVTHAKPRRNQFFRWIDFRYSTRTAIFPRVTSSATPESGNRFAEALAPDRHLAASVRGEREASVDEARDLAVREASAPRRSAIRVRSAGRVRQRHRGGAVALGAHAVAARAVAREGLRPELGEHGVEGRLGAPRSPRPPRARPGARSASCASRTPSSGT